MVIRFFTSKSTHVYGVAGALAKGSLGGGKLNPYAGRAEQACRRGCEAGVLVNLGERAKLNACR